MGIYEFDDKGLALQIGGNTVGAGTALVSSGTLSLAAGANITLSQDGGNAVTIIGGAGGGAGGSFSAGVSTLGNTLGTTGTVSNQIVFAGGNNITLSQSSAAGGATVTISAFNASVQPEGTQTLGMSNLGNTSGTTGVVTGTGVRFLFAGGNNVTLSQSLDAASVSGTITISAANQTVQTQNLVDVTLAGNTAGVLALVSSGTLTLAGGNNITLSQAGNAVTISAFNASVQPEGTQTLGMSNLGNTSGTTGVVTGTGVRYLFAGGNNITLSQSLDAGSVSGTITISGPNDQTGISGISAGTTQATSGTVVFSNSNGISFGMNAGTVTAKMPSVTLMEFQGIQLFVAPAANTVLAFVRNFPQQMSATMVDMIWHMTGSSAAASGNITFSVGLYTMTGSTANSASTTSGSYSWTSGSDTSASSRWAGQSGTRYRSIGLGTWNITPGPYLIAWGFSSGSSQTAASWSVLGQMSVNISGIGTDPHQAYFVGGARTAAGALPASFHLTDLTQTGNAVLFSPYMAFIGTF